jgi:hypothetical protein
LCRIEDRWHVVVQMIGKAAAFPVEVDELIL